VRRIPREEWVRTPVRQAMTVLAERAPVGPEDDAVTVLERMIREDASPLPVVQDGRLIGILSRRDVLKVFQVRATLGEAS
jgi:CBS domain-containing protein